MGESSKVLDQALGFLRGFPRSVRISVLVLLLVPLAIFLNGRYNWPHDGLVKDSLWMNCIGSVFIVAGLFALLWYTPRPAMSVQDLPTKKPVFDDSLQYFKDGPQQDGPRRDLLKGMQLKFVNSTVPNQYELPPDQVRDCAGSPWDFDRVAFYLYVRYKEKPALEERIKGLKHEMRLLDTRGWQGSLVPLHYVVESILSDDEDETAPILSMGQREPFEEIIKNLNTPTARLRGLFMGKRGKKIIDNCRTILRTEMAQVAGTAQGASKGKSLMDRREGRRD